MLRTSIVACASLIVMGAIAPCRGQESPTLLETIAQWQYPGSKMSGATMSDAATVNASGERTAPSIQYKTVLTTPDPMAKVIEYYQTRLNAAADSKTARPLDKPAANSSRSVTSHDDSENRPLAIHVILVNTDQSSTTLVISRAQAESETHIAWTRYVRH